MSCATMRKMIERIKREKKSKPRVADDIEFTIEGYPITGMFRVSYHCLEYNRLMYLQAPTLSDCTIHQTDFLSCSGKWPSREEAIEAIILFKEQRFKKDITREVYK